MADERDHERERRSLPGLALDPEPAAEVLDDLTADREPQPRSPRLRGQRVTDLAKLLEDDRLVIRRDPRPIVAHVDADRAGQRAERDGDPPPGVGAKLRRVGEEVDHDLHEAIAVRHYPRDLVREVQDRKSTRLNSSHVK